MFYVISNDELYHHGIKGQKWGVRRFQNEDGSLTPAGEKRYYGNSNLIEQEKALKVSKQKRNEAYVRWSNATASNLNQRKKEFEQANSDYARKKLLYKADAEASRIKSKNIEFKNKSKHRLKLEEQYKKLGLTDEQAQAAANGRIRTERILAVSSAVGITACAAYIANKKLRDRIDGVIKAGETMQRIEMQDTGGKLNNMFYAAKGKHDERRYFNLLGSTRQQQLGHAYVMKLEASKDIKVASKDNAAKIFGELYKNDPDFRKAATEYTKAHFGGGNRLNPNDLSNRNIKKMYENFNANLPDIRDGGSGIDKQFYSKLKSAGYGAIQDINDMKYSGYNAKNPLIIFDNSSSNVMVKSMSEITDDLSLKGVKELVSAMLEKSFTKNFETGAVATTLGVSGAAIYTHNKDDSKNKTYQKNKNK